MIDKQAKNAPLNFLTRRREEGVLNTLQETAVYKLLQAVAVYSLLFMKVQNRYLTSAIGNWVQKLDLGCLLVLF